MIEIPCSVPTKCVVSIKIMEKYLFCRKDLLSVDDIEQIIGKKRKSNKEERMASVKVLLFCKK